MASCPVCRSPRPLDSMACPKCGDPPTMSITTDMAETTDDLIAPADCESLGRTDYDDGFFAGKYENFVSCGGTDTEYVVVATISADGTYGVVVAVQVVTAADYEALDQIMRTFNVTTGAA